MNVKDFSQKKAHIYLATQSRRADLKPLELGKIHFEMGCMLGYELLEEFEFTTIEIQHVQGVRKSLDLAAKDQIVIVAMMRAGLYAAEGVRHVFNESAFVLYNRPEDLGNNLTGKKVILIDSVINTGKSIQKTIDILIKLRVSKIFVATLVMQSEATFLARKYPMVAFYAFRVSKNKYVGKGGTDTGNRLFGTINFEQVS